MTARIETTEPGRPSVSFMVCVYAAALVLGGTTWFAVHMMSTDDCTTVTTTHSDGSQITTQTCS